MDTNVFSSKSRAAADLPEPMRALARMPARAGIFTDFDGSLAPIVADPGRARAVRGAHRILTSLAKRYAVVAVVSGRPVSYLAKHLHARGVRMVGLYGIEERIGRTLSVLPDVQAARAAVDEAATRLTGELAQMPGIYVENKGFAVSVHFRRAPDPERAAILAEPIVMSVATDTGLAPLMRGRKVLEIGPKVSVDKGEVVRQLVERFSLEGALVIGDDTGDLAMFDAVSTLIHGVRLAVMSDESPPELKDACDVSVSSPVELVALLKTLASATRP